MRFRYRGIRRRKMTCDLKTFDADQLLAACAYMEGALIAFINKCNRQGMDTTELKEVLDYVHAAVDGLSDD